MTFNPTPIETDPTIRSFENVLYLPFQGDAANPRRWGVFDRGNLIVDAAALLAGAPHGQDSAVDLVEAVERDGQTYVYGGLMHPHFGHFLLTSLSRFWTVHRDVKYLVHGNIPPNAWFQQPAIGECLRALGLSKSDFVVLQKPTLIQRLIVPAPSLIEEWSVHRAFGRMGAQIGQSLAPGAPAPADRPVYFTKLQHKCGVWRFENEAELVNRLDRAGVEIIAPEAQPLPDQIRLVQSRPIISPMGSAHHLSIFAQTGCRFTILNHAGNVHPNFMLVDSVKGNDSQYVRAPGGASFRHDDPAFHAVVRLADPVGCAEALLRDQERKPASKPRAVKTAVLASWFGRFLGL